MTKKRQKSANRNLVIKAARVDGKSALYEINPPSSYPCFRASIDDLDLKIVKEYSDNEEPGLYESNELTIVLDKLGFYSGITPNQKILHKAAVLCFHNKPQILYPNHRVV